jgi:pimeloyl-ACP methyl ester carboxylesterase
MINSVKFLLLATVFASGYIVNGQSQVNATFHSVIIETGAARHALKSIKLQSGVRLEYAEQGSTTGTPVIFLHGYTDSWQSFNQVLPLLPESIHAYAISQRGHGASDQPVVGYTPDDFALDVADFMRELDINSAIIVGHSMGATVAQRFALDYPYMAKALVLVGAFASFTTNAGIAELRSIVDRIEDPVDSGFVYEFQKSTLFKPIPPQALQTYVNESKKLPARVWKAVATEALSVDYSKALENLSMPTLIMWGDKDIFCPESDQYILAKAIRKSTLLLHEGVGHAIHWEDPERFTSNLLSFINTIEENRKAITEDDLKEAFFSGSYF